MRRMFLKIETENCQNQEAASLYQNDKSEFKSKVKELRSLTATQIVNCGQNEDSRLIRWVSHKCL